MGAERGFMSILAVVLAIAGLGFLALVWVAVLLSVGRLAWRATIRSMA